MDPRCSIISGNKVKYFTLKLQGLDAQSYSFILFKARLAAKDNFSAVDMLRAQKDKIKDFCQVEIRLL